MGFLETIVAEKRDDVIRKSRAVPLARLEDAAKAVPLRDFRAALLGRAGSVIAELKLRTPTIPGFANGGDPAALACIYAEAGAAAVSVVTEAARFGTSLETVTYVRMAVDLPVLAKDFVIDPYQIVEARAAGADAVLLIARLVDGSLLADLVGRVQGLGMEAIVEVHDEKDLDSARAAHARCVGLNNRNLDTMEVSLDTTRRLAPLVPADVTVIAESGIRTRADIDDLAAHGAQAFLVGGALLEAEDPGALLRALTTKEVAA
ncbi:MAG: indole-3-glycerol phosphate synthase TrpC [Candidatus Krumholzibacteria bacterium]|nr:indole-3-glycerol phosphate synthase TrpC [Candidatus Krumholzibacteria bacterium]